MIVPNNNFFQACSTGKTGVVVAYLDSGVDPNARDHYQLTGLIWAAVAVGSGATSST